MQERKVPPAEELKELDRLERGNVRLKKENDLLKKSQRHLADQHQKGLDPSKPTDKN